MVNPFNAAITGGMPESLAWSVVDGLSDDWFGPGFGIEDDMCPSHHPDRLHFI